MAAAAALRACLAQVGKLKTSGRMARFATTTSQTMRGYSKRWMDAESPSDGHFTDNLQVNRPGLVPPIPAYRVMDEAGSLLNTPDDKSDGETMVEIYRQMVFLRAFDVRMTLAHDNGLISFYLTSEGEEACQIASAAALQHQDLVFAQYREPGVLLWRGMSSESLMDTCFGNSEDMNKGRQMPIHYGSRQHNFVTISSTVGTQTPQAVGAAYAYKLSRPDACVVTYFGDGGTSTGDVHAAMNFASTLKTPAIFFCRNNRLAITTPIQEQMRCDGVVERGHGYGMWTIRVDGNDALAVHEATLHARDITLTDRRPVLIEAMTYRVGDHSSNVDGYNYRDDAKPEAWRRSNNPFVRLRNYLTVRDLWNPQLEVEWEQQANEQIEAAFERSMVKPTPNMETMFTDVYSDVPANLQAQRDYLLRHLSLYPQEYNKESSNM